jgi:hypothetical protein
MSQGGYFPGTGTSAAPLTVGARPARTDRGGDVPRESRLSLGHWCSTLSRRASKRGNQCSLPARRGGRRLTRRLGHRR